MKHKDNFSNGYDHQMTVSSGLTGREKLEGLVAAPLLAGTLWFIGALTLRTIQGTKDSYDRGEFRQPILGVTVRGDGATFADVALQARMPVTDVLDIGVGYTPTFYGVSRPNPDFFKNAHPSTFMKPGTRFLVRGDELCKPLCQKPKTEIIVK